MAPTHLRQVVINLVANAVEATSGIGRAVRVSTVRRLLEREEAERLALDPSRSYVCIAVSDDGPGIEPAIAARIFEPLFTTKDQGKGTGIGLATCQRIVREAKGAIVVDSTVGRGSTFSVLLPEAKTNGAFASQAQRRTPGPASTNVLVVEDHPVIRRSVVLMLVDAGYHVIECASLREAYDALDRLRIDLLAIDDALPDGSGRAFAARIRQHYPKLKTLLVSGSAKPKEPGFDATIAKPFTHDELLAVVERTLAIA